MPLSHNKAKFFDQLCFTDFALHWSLLLPRLCAITIMSALNFSCFIFQGKGTMKTYWLVDKKEISEEDLPKYPFIAAMEEEVKNRNRDEQIENSSRHHVDSGQPLSSSPVPYSPVSYKDVFDDRSSLAGRKFSRGSGEGEALRLGATMTPRGSRASLPGCPFAMGLFSGPGSADSHPRASDFYPARKKNSIDLMYSSIFNITNPTTSSLYMSSYKEERPGLAGKDDSGSPSYKNLNMASSFGTASQPFSSRKLSVPETAKTFPSSHTQSSRDSIIAPPSASSNGTTSDTEASDSHTKPTDSSPSGVQPRNNESCSCRTSPSKSVSPFLDRAIDSASVMPCLSRTESETNVTKQNFPFSAPSNKDGGHIRETNAPSGNGSIGHKITPTQQDFDKFPPDKRSGMVNGNHVIKNEFGCISGTSFDRSRSQRKSKACNIL